MKIMSGQMAQAPTALDYTSHKPTCRWRQFGVALAATWSVLAWPGQSPAAEQVLWQMGQFDKSDHEFSGSPDTRSNRLVVVRIGSGEEAKRWPKFHPGTGNGAFGGRAHRFSLVFDLPDQAPRGVFYLELGLLFRLPRAPALELEINGHRGRYYFNPAPMFDIGDTDDQFNAIRSVERRKIVLPAAFFNPGENVLGFTAIDDPPILTHNRAVGGQGDSGFFYDAVALSQDSQAMPQKGLEISLTPTVFFPKTAKGVQDECELIVGFPSSWPGGSARVTLGRVSWEAEIAEPAEFGEARASFLLPANLPAGKARVELTEARPDPAAGGLPAPRRTWEFDFTPAKQWKIFYAPNEHLDVGYTDYRAKVAEVHARNVDDLMKVLAGHPAYRFNLDGSWILEQWLDLRSPRYTAQITSHARAGQIGMNAFYCCPATEYLSLEENFRNLYFSKAMRERYGIPFDFALISDVPSASWSVPSVLAAAGVRYFADGGNQHRAMLMAHGHWNVRSPFWWEGPDGARVLAWFSSHYHQLKAVAGLPPAVASAKGGLRRFLRAYEDAAYQPDAVLLYGTEVENLPTDYDDASFVERWNAEFEYPRLITCRFSEFFQYMEAHFGRMLPVVRGTGGAYWADNFGALPAATARDRANQSRVISAETLASLTCMLDAKLRFPQRLDHDIWRNTILYSEHNFGTGRGANQPESDEVTRIIRETENWTAEAGAEIDKLMRLGMSQLADRIQTEGRNLIVFNPLPWRRDGLVTFQADVGTALTNLAAGEPVTLEVLAEQDGYQTLRFRAEAVPALGYHVYRFGHAPARHLRELTTPGNNVVENHFYKVSLDPARAAIQSIYDKELGRELLDPASPYRGNEYLFVSGGGTESGRGRGPENSRLLDTFGWLPAAELTVHHPEGGVLGAIEETPWGWRIRMTASAEHTPRIEAEILLPNNEKRIELHNQVQVDLLYAKQASYFAFPWAISDPVFRYDIPNGFVNPAKDLLQGGCSDWFIAQQVVDVADRGASVSLATVEAPLVCLGDIFRGRWAAQFTNRSPAVFSYALNNYWSPKWAGKKSGDLSFSYVITSQGRFDPVAAARFGREARCPLEVAELKLSDKLPGLRGKLPPTEASLGTLAPDNLVLTALKPAEDGHGQVLRLLETGGQECDGIFQLAFCRITVARAADAVETSGKPLPVDAAGVRFHIKPYQALTLRLVTKERGP
ncbi:putative Glycosyl hydrolases 38-like protein [Verrucomicrobia bacterium]|nr:putative Glycosyl hydrolases 38-like protein [Verrucomicrobiota bacterium]